MSYSLIYREVKLSSSGRVRYVRFHRIPIGISEVIDQFARRHVPRRVEVLNILVDSSLIICTYINYS